MISGFVPIILSLTLLVADPNWTQTKLDFFMTIIWGYLLVHLVVSTKFTYVYGWPTIGYTLYTHVRGTL